jgi:hypothetical protein
MNINKNCVTNYTITILHVEFLPFFHLSPHRKEETVDTNKEKQKKKSTLFEKSSSCIG